MRHQATAMASDVAVLTLCPDMDEEPLAPAAAQTKMSHQKKKKKKKKSRRGDDSSDDEPLRQEATNPRRTGKNGHAATVGRANHGVQELVSEAMVLSRRALSRTLPL